MEPMTLATLAVGALVPYLTTAADGAATRVGESAAEGAGKLLGWVKARLGGGRAAEALADLEAAPDSADNQADLRKQLARALADQPALQAELAALLQDVPAAAPMMVQSVSGQGAMASQVSGSGHHVQMMNRAPRE